MRTKDRKPLAVTRIKMANSEETFCRVGFPLKSVEKYIPTRLSYDAEDDKHIVISVELPKPTDGTEITHDRLAEAVKKWKEAQPIKQPKGQEGRRPKGGHRPTAGARATETKTHQDRHTATGNNGNGRRTDSANHGLSADQQHTDGELCLHRAAEAADSRHTLNVGNISERLIVKQTTPIVRRYRKTSS